MNLKNAAIIAAGIILAAPVVAQAGEQANIFNFPAGYTTINPQTCKFVTPEVDKRPSATERYARAEDVRDDVLFQCIRKLAVKANKPQPPTTPEPDQCWSEAGEVPRDSGIQLRNYLDKLQDCETHEIEGRNG